MLTCTVAVHDGVFHADDVFSVALLWLVFKESVCWKVIRTRNAEKLKKASMRVDVGGIYNVETNDFDHHQAGGAGRRKNGVPFASLGLLWKKYGLTLCEENQEVFDEVDRQFIQSIDADDNGFSVYKLVVPGIPVVTVSQIIYNMNPSWEDRLSADSYFAQAVEMAKMILTAQINKQKDAVRSRVFLYSALATRSNPQILVLDRAVSWQKIICSQDKQVLFVVFPNSSGENWLAQCVPVDSGSFKTRMSFPKKWSAKIGEQLVLETGVSDALFCHAKCFIAGARTCEGAIALAEKALKLGGY